MLLVESVSRILQACGAEVISVGYHGDIGLHVAKAVWALKYDSKNEKDKKSVFNYAKLTLGVLRLTKRMKTLKEKLLK